MTSRLNWLLFKASRPTLKPTTEALKGLIDAVIAATKSEAEAARLEICRAYLFNPRLAGKLEKQMLTQISKQAAHPQ